jgi:hypothetical protein
MVFYRQTDFSIDDTNISVKLEKPEDHVHMTPERFQYIIDMQETWRKEYISNKRKNLLERRRLSYERKYTEQGLPIPVKRSRRGRPSLTELTEQINNPIGQNIEVC